MELGGSSTEAAGNIMTEEVETEVAQAQEQVGEQDDLRQDMEKLDCWTWFCLNCCDYDRRVDVGSDPGNEQLGSETGRVGR